MTTRKLLDFFEEFYGEKYSGVFLEVMTNYLDGFSDGYLDAIAAVVVEKFPRHFNKSPDPAIIEENMLRIRMVWESRVLKRDVDDDVILHLKKTMLCLMEMIREIDKKDEQDEALITEILELKLDIDKLLRAAHENPDYKIKNSDVQLLQRMDAFFKKHNAENKEGDVE